MSDQHCRDGGIVQKGATPAQLHATLEIDEPVMHLARVKNHVWGCGLSGVYLWHATVRGTLLAPVRTFAPRLISSADLFFCRRSSTWARCKSSSPSDGVDCCR
jgi:hypothetical protein